MTLWVLQCVVCGHMAMTKHQRQTDPTHKLQTHKLTLTNSHLRKPNQIKRDFGEKNKLAEEEVLAKQFFMKKKKKDYKGVT